MEKKDEIKALLTKQSTTEEIRAYFNGVLEVAKSKKEFPVNLDDVWGLVYGAKGDAVSALKRTFVEGVDYTVQTLECQSLGQTPKRTRGGQNKLTYMLSTSCLEYFIARKVRPVFEVYRQVFHKAASNVPLTYKDALKQLIAQEEARERLEAENREQQMQLEMRKATIEQQSKEIQKAAPKVEYYDRVLAAKGDLNVSEIARFLGMTAAELNAKLRDAGIIYKTSAKSKTWLLRKPYCDWNLANARTSVFLRSDGSEGASVMTVYNQRGVRFIRALHQCGYDVRKAVALIQGENSQANVETRGAY